MGGERAAGPEAFSRALGRLSAVRGPWPGGMPPPGAGASRRACRGRPFRPADGCLSTLRVRPVPGRTGIAQVQWSGRFSPRGATEDEAVALFTGTHRDGLDALHRALAV
ncbi:hypothetical protein HEP81_07843 [Streptomyces griseofuscus]|uniref:Polyketide cyclase / dehydrase and lipid transport n=2 Tax=Streptomyces griseofuscus TaxID=146922 RepID=A0A7H1QCP3_9ACTN|nr:hypothetical protein HEP81_00035 [Streptomyces griseofuscus]QNT98073.1 hypothetical protein HEP81_07843 [Streptomyces griseofuscus]